MRLKAVLLAERCCWSLAVTAYGKWSRYLPLNLISRRQFNCVVCCDVTCRVGDIVCRPKVCVGAHVDNFGRVVVTINISRSASVAAECPSQLKLARKHGTINAQLLVACIGIEPVCIINAARTNRREVWRLVDFACRDDAILRVVFVWRRRKPRVHLRDIISYDDVACDYDELRDIA